MRKRLLLEKLQKTLESLIEVSLERFYENLGARLKLRLLEIYIEQKLSIRIRRELY